MLVIIDSSYVNEGIGLAKLFFPYDLMENVNEFFGQPYNWRDTYIPFAIVLG